MIIIFAESDDGQIRPVRIKNLAMFTELAEQLLAAIGFNKVERQLRNTSNFFPHIRPTAEYHVAAALSGVDWVLHSNGQNTPLDEVRRYWGCYQPHLILGDVERVFALPEAFFCNLTHIVVPKANDNIKAFAAKHKAKLFEMKIIHKNAQWLLEIKHVE